MPLQVLFCEVFRHFVNRKVQSVEKGRAEGRDVVAAEQASNAFLLQCHVQCTQAVRLDAFAALETV